MLALVAGGETRGAYIEDKTTLWLVALASESYDPAESGTRKVVYKVWALSCRQRLKPGFWRSICGTPEGCALIRVFSLISKRLFFAFLAVPFECPWASISSTSPSSLYI
jgi:hypothetical protein